MKCGIYQIKNNITNDIYIGQSIDIPARLWTHFSKLRNGKGNKIFQNAFNKYGECHFAPSVLVYCEPNELDFYEQKMVDIRSPKYNALKIIVTSPKGTPGHKQSEETKRKIGEANKKHQLSELCRQNQRKAVAGRIHSIEEKEKRTASNTGKKRSEEFKKHLSEINIGKKVSDESKRRMSESAKNRRKKERK